MRIVAPGPGVWRFYLFSPLFKAVLLGFFLWLVLHRQLRDWMYAGDIWHPLLMDLSLFALSVCLALVLLTVW